MFSLTKEHFSELLRDHQAPCLSLFLPTERKFPASEENPRRFRNLLDGLQRQLDRSYPDVNAQPLLDRLSSVDQGREFWSHQRQGLAVFCSSDYFRQVQLPRRVDELVVVGDSFYTKPLIRLLQSADRFQVLCLEQHQALLYEGDRYDLEPLPLKNLPVSALELLETRRAGQGAQLGKGQDGSEAGRFARLVDAAVWDQYSRRNALPLILCADADYQSIFRRISRNANLLPQGIRINPKRLGQERILAEAWKILEPHFRERIDRIIDVFRAAEPRKLASADLPDISRAVALGKVGTLLLDEQKHIPARFDHITGLLEPTAAGGNNDVLGDLAETVLKRDGQVLILPHDQMPTQTGVAAIYRY